MFSICSRQAKCKVETTHIAGTFGFTGISATAGGVARVLFLVFLALTAIVPVISLMVGRFAF